MRYKRSKFVQQYDIISSRLYDSLYSVSAKKHGQGQHTKTTKLTEKKAVLKFVAGTYRYLYTSRLKKSVYRYEYAQVGWSRSQHTHRHQYQSICTGATLGVHTLLFLTWSIVRSHRRNYWVASCWVASLWLPPVVLG